ncbi:hypothetical protein MRB53_039412 [Persea americana]|nr:hypothetical protein MRB53_039412 [Persea americana]
MRCNGRDVIGRSGFRQNCDFLLDVDVLCKCCTAAYRTAHGLLTVDKWSYGFLAIMRSSRPTLTVLRQAVQAATPPKSTSHQTLRCRLVQAQSHSTPSAHRDLHSSTRQARAAAEPAIKSSNPPLSFPCLDAVESRSASLTERASAGPEPSYTTGEHLRFHSDEPLLLDWGGRLPHFDIAYEAWGTLNETQSNAILLHTGLSASSHAHSTATNRKPGWWEKFIGSGKPLDTDKYFVICTNVIGGCYGSTGPSSQDPANGQRYGTRFPILTMEDMVRAQFRLLDSLGISKLYASVGSSMGGMQSLAAGVLFPDRVGRIASISGCARSHPYSIAMRHTQRQVLMVDPNWSRGFYYDKVPPHAGMKLAREIATVTYRSGPEWEQRFGRRRADPSKPPALSKQWTCSTLGKSHQNMMESRRQARSGIGQADLQTDACNLVLPETPYEEQSSQTQSTSDAELQSSASKMSGGPPDDLVQGLAPLANTPALVMGVASDILFPAWQQREIADTLRKAGNRSVTHIELGEDKSIFGHDTFLLDLEHVGGALKSFLE